MEAEAPLPGRVSYFLGNDPSRWQAGLATYARVRYQGVYPGIDLVWHGGDGALEYDFELAPGADPGTIGLRLEGAEQVTLAPDGALVMTLGGAELRQHAPVVYQEVAGRRTAVRGGYTLDPTGAVGFWLDAYDPMRPVVIDPLLGYSHYLGGTGADEGLGIAVEGSGSAYVTGSTVSNDFPTAGRGPAKFGAGALGQTGDAFVAKLNPAGTALVYSVYLGGGDLHEGRAIAVDASGSAYVTGWTISADFPPAGGGPPSLAGVALARASATRLWRS